MGITLIVPSRERPQNMERLMVALSETVTTYSHSDFHLVIAIDNNDPTIHNYEDLEQIVTPRLEYRVTVEVGPQVGCMASLNRYSQKYVDSDIVGFMGDDHVPRTPWWNQMVEQTLASPGLCYGNDLLQGAALPTACFMSGEILRLLNGNMVPTVLYHLYCDNYWLMLGANAGCLRYLPGMIIEHMHPAAGKVAVDDRYRHVNSGEMYQRDGEAWEKFKEGPLRDEVAKIRQMLYG